VVNSRANMVETHKDIHKNRQMFLELDFPPHKEKYSVKLTPSLESLCFLNSCITSKCRKGKTKTYCYEFFGKHN